MKILIIGNEGFIGGHMARRLLEKGHEVIGLDVNTKEQNKDGYIHNYGDILNKDDVIKAAKGCGLVINLAAKHHDFGISREDFFLINEQGTKNCLSCLSSSGINKFIFYSTVAVYGNVDDCASELIRVNPANDYGESKLSAEKLIQDWAAEDNTRQALIIRPTVVFGPNNWANMYKLINAVYHKRFVRVGKGDNIKSLSYVENLVNGTMFLMERMRPGIDIYNYSDYEHLTSAETIHTITDCMGRKRSNFYLPLAPIAAVTKIIDVTGKMTGKNFHITSNRIKKLNTKTMYSSDKLRKLGYEQEISLKEGIRRMVDWYLKYGKFHVERSR